MGRELEITLPTFHPDQIRAFEVWRKNKYVAGRCGRRWGKTDFAKTIAADYMLKGRNVGWFAPSYKIMSEAYSELALLLNPVIPSRGGASKTEGVIRTITGGRTDFWSLENERAGRSRKYHQVIVDEGAFAKANFATIWEQAIEPTLLDYSTLPYGGRCLIISNTNSIAEDNFFYMICETQVEKWKFTQFHAPTSNNPYMPASRLAELKASKHPLVWQQEYLAEFVDFSGESFFSSDKLLLDGKPVPQPVGVESVFAVIDTAVKEGKEHDATAVSFWALMPAWFEPYKLVCLDWDLVSIDGAMLETWIPNVFAMLEHFAKVCKAVNGSVGAFIEDANSGSILLQQCALRNWPAEALPSELQMAGKDARAINASSPVYCGYVKFSENAYTKTTTFKETHRNHMLSQVSGFRVGDKDAAKRSDDLFDTFTYAVAITLGDSEGIA
jgi:hypothetical protein